MSTNIFESLEKKYPFISVIKYGDNEYIGIVQNRDDYITNFYDFTSLKEAEMKQKFLELGDQWWQESNRKIPINLFFRTEWQQFRCVLRTFNSRELILLHGPAIKLSDLLITKCKRRSIIMIKRSV